MSDPIVLWNMWEGGDWTVVVNHVVGNCPRSVIFQSLHALRAFRVE